MQQASENKVLMINEDNLKELIDYISSSLVGKVLKRFEILDDKNAIKLNVKELIYEEFRQFRDLIIAHNSGFNIRQFKFTPKKDTLASPAKTE